MKIDELEARLKEKDPTATATSTGANRKKIRLKKGGIVKIRSPKSNTIVPDLLSADFMVSKALEKAAAAAAVTSEKMDVLPAAPHCESQINDEVAGIVVSTELGAEAAFARPSQQLPEAIPSTPSTDDLALAEMSEEWSSRVTELEEKNRQLEARNKELAVQLQNQQPTIDHFQKQNHQLTLQVQTYKDQATQAEATNSDLLERYGRLEKEQLEVKDQYEGLKRSWNDAILENEVLKKKLLKAEESGVTNWQQSPNFLNEVITRAMGQPEQRRKFFQVLEANPAGKIKLLDDNTNACLHGMRKMQQAIYNQLREIAPDDFDVQEWGLPKQLIPDTESQNEAAGSSMQGPDS